MIATCVAESAIRDCAALIGLAYAAVPVGFKNIVDRWKRDGRRPTLGIEPNGGLAVAWDDGSYFERDGLANATFVLDRFTTADTFDAAIAEVRSRRQFEPRQFATSRSYRDTLTEVSTSWPGASVSEMDGVAELSWPGGARVLIRASGTEALTRCYAECPDEILSWFDQALCPSTRHEPH